MTVKVPGKGTKGAPFPRFMARLTNGLVIRRFRGGHMTAVAGMPTLLLETRGARSGHVRQVVLGYLAEGGSWLIVASTSGATWNPAWLYNLAHDPEATIQFVDGRRIAVLAETLDGPPLEAAWQRIAAEAPRYAGYRSKTDRKIPVVRLREQVPT
jgi:deazaflavin-dependent oxidoreductase (nitroreductase family)